MLALVIRTAVKAAVRREALATGQVHAAVAAAHHVLTFYLRWLAAPVDALAVGPEHPPDEHDDQD